MTTPEERAGERVADALTGVLRCPNCLEVIKGHKDNDCVLNIFIGILRDRGNKTDEELEQLHARCSTDALWDGVAKVLNDLEDGQLSHD